MRAAVIDCGTNSVRLLIADMTVTDGEIELTDCVRTMEVVRLGQGVDSHGRVSPEALERLAKALDGFAAIIERYKPEQTTFVATSATRDAANAEEVHDVVRRHLGVEPNVITGDQEALYSFTGAVSAVDVAPAENVLVLDLGGGSTEFVIGREGEVLAEASTQMGAVRYAERFIHSDPPLESEKEAIAHAVRDVLTELSDTIDLSTVDRLVGVAGTGTTVLAHALDLPAYVPERITGASIPVPLAIAICGELASFSKKRLADLPYMHPGRVDIMAGGAMILKTILETVHERSKGRVKELAASENDILDGVALELMRRTL